PWHPFHSLLEFDLVEALFEARLSNRQVDSILSIIHGIVEHPGCLKVKDHRQVKNLWSSAPGLHGLSPFKRDTVVVSYETQDHKFDFWSRSLKAWISQIVEDPYLATVIQWSAMKLSKFDGKVWVPFVNEPWTAARMWNVQSKLPPDGVPMCIVLYADKTNLTASGSVQGYPIMAQLHNVPQEIRNGKGLGSIQVVGWLPVIGDDEQEKGKTEYTDFKKSV
ncbi:hypothetical protein BDZ94DRAFT_1148708, partial [Collybia nuda]